MKFGLDYKYYEMIKNVLCKIDDIEQVIIFGSRATDKATKGSDIDLALKGEKVNLELVLKILGNLDELPIAYKFDIVNYNQIPAELKEQIDKYGKVFM